MKKTVEVQQYVINYKLAVCRAGFFAFGFWVHCQMEVNTCILFTGVYFCSLGPD